MTDLLAQSVESFEKSIFVCAMVKFKYLSFLQVSLVGNVRINTHKQYQQRRASDQQTFLCYTGRTFSEYRIHSDISKLFRDSSCTSACLALLILYLRVHLQYCNSSIDRDEQLTSRSCITLVVLFWPRAGAPDSEEQLILEKNDAHPEENINKLHVSIVFSCTLSFLRSLIL